MAINRNYLWNFNLLKDSINQSLKWLFCFYYGTKETDKLILTEKKVI